MGSEMCIRDIDVSKELNISSLTLKGLVRRSVEFDFKGHNIVPLKEEE